MTRSSRWKSVSGKYNKNPEKFSQQAIHFRSRFASAVHLIPPASDKELVEIAKDDLLSVLPSEEKYRELWIESVEDGFMGLYDHLVDFAKFVFVISMCL